MSFKALTALCFNMSSVVQDDQGQWLPMIPAGQFTGIDGRPWNNAYPERVVASFVKKLPFDVEHSTQLKAPKGEPAPAVGWIVKLEIRDGEIWGLIEWNEDGQQLIDKKNYAYYSPAFAHTQQGVVANIESAGLTNDPNLGVPALNRKEDLPMPLPKQLTDALGLQETATEQDAVTAITNLKEEKMVALNRAEKFDLNTSVPKETYDVALNRAIKAEAAVQQIEDQKMEALVQAAIDDGKIAPANKDMFVAMCRSQGAEQFTAFVSTAPAIATNAQKKTTTTAQGEGELTADEVALCRAMNVSHESWIAARKHKPNY
ncbi:phage protease [Vibrio anguillarum]|uniref:phage protease n=1 Tax=Vibrio anguillarum TaxID=55601 RepID=UPI0002EF1D2E|nr:phage protease [Vibrio anguillarum]OEE50471.1 peptidase [Vibrio anguillarum]